MGELVTKFGYRYLTKHRTRFMVGMANATIYGIAYTWCYYGPNQPWAE